MTADRGELLVVGSGRGEERGGEAGMAVLWSLVLVLVLLPVPVLAWSSDGVDVSRLFLGVGGRRGPGAWMREGGRSVPLPWIGLMTGCSREVIGGCGREVSEDLCRRREGRDFMTRFERSERKHVSREEIG